MMRRWRSAREGKGREGGAVAVVQPGSIDSGILGFFSV